MYTVYLCVVMHFLKGGTDMAATKTSSPNLNIDKKSKSLYSVFKRIFDVVFSFVFMLVLSPVFLVLMLLIFLTDKGSPFFIQKRVGKDKKHFNIIKFRTMYTDTDANIPTHLLEDPEQFLTPIGKFLRKASLDELPQLINIFIGQMSFIGPRPALWNQFDLIDERDKYGANSVRPGLSGWAQINGRDELPIDVKARLDGEYVKKMNLLFDLKCFFGTLTSVLTARGVQEGGTLGNENRPLRICMVTTIAKAFDWFVSDSARNFAANGFEVTIVCGGMSEEFIKKHERFAKVCEVPFERGVSLSSIIRSRKALKKIFKEGKFDVIQYATPNAALCCTLTRGFKKIPVRVYGQWGLRYVGFEGIKRKLFKAIEKFTCKGATTIYSVSPKNREISIKEKLCKEEKIAVIGIGGTVGVDLNVYDLNRKDEFRKEIRAEYLIDDDTFVFAYIGRLNKDKGVGELLSAYRALLHTHKNTKLFLVGMEDNTNPPDKELMDWAKGSEDVYITGHKAPSEVSKFMAASDLLVHPTYREGFSMVLQEAMAMKLPIITTDVPGPSEVVEEGISGVLVPPKNDKALLLKMTELMENKALRESLAENGRERVKKYFARPIMLRNIFDFYIKLLGISQRHIKLMYLTADPEAAKTAEVSGVDRIFLDLEVLGKFERQGHLDTVVSHSSLEDIKKIREVINKSQLLVRCNPMHEGLKAEIDRIIREGADIIMFPFFKTALEVKKFLEYVDGRVPTVLLFETAEAVENVEEILSLEGISEVYIGLNDLHLSYKMKFMFELLADGTVERLCEKFKAKGLPYGFGGIAKIGEGLLKSEYVIGEHKRLGSTCAILSRTFRHEVSGSRPVEDTTREISALRRRENEVSTWIPQEFEENRQLVIKKVSEIVEKVSCS